MDLVAERLTQEAFAPYGDVIAVPVRPGRKYTHPASAMRAPARGEPLDGDAGAGRRLAVRGEAPRAARVFLADSRAARCWTWTWLVVVCPRGRPRPRLDRRSRPGHLLPHEHLASRVHRARPAGTLCHVHVARRYSGDEEFVSVTPFHHPPRRLRCRGNPNATSPAMAQSRPTPIGRTGRGSRSI